MGYGIAKVTDTSIMYCSSSYSRYFSTNITDAVEFVQEKSAQKAIKDMMNSGDFERDVKFCTFQLIKVQGTLNEVSWPKVKEGIVLEFNSEYYGGSKNPKSSLYPRYFGSKEKASIFKNEKDAQVILDGLLKAVQQTAESEKSVAWFDYYEDMKHNLKIGRI